MSMNTQSNQRKRVPIACLACRAKRTKCDGDPIQCSACKYRGSPCEYVHTPNNRKPPRKEYVAALQARVKTLEDELALARESGWGGDSGSVPETEPPAFDNEDDVASPESTASHGTSGTSSAAIEEVTDILGRFAIGDGGELCYFGSRSNFNLLRSSTVRSMSNMDMQRRGYEAAAAQVGLVGVSRDLQSHLLHLFWSWQNSWQYIVCEGPFLQDLGSHPDSPFGRFCSPALLYAILALASRYTDDERVRTDPEDPRTAGDAFAAQARVMLLYECETPTPTTVQALALTCLREMALNKEALGWMYCGMCVRMAINLGMHLDCSPCVSEGTLSAEEAEVRNVTWWGCYVLDKLFNIGLGRPSMIQARDVTAEPPNICCMEELRPWQGIEALPNPILATASHNVTNAIYTCKLFTLMGDVLDSIYTPSDRRRPGPHIRNIVSEGHVKLVKFLDALPACLRISKSSRHPSPPHVYQLHLQYHVIMILLHRPFLQSTRPFQGFTLSETGRFDVHTVSCRKAAQWIATILQIYHKNFTLRKLPISAVHCAFTAAVIFLADATSEDNELQQESLKNLKTCYRSLQGMRIAWGWSERAISALEQIAIRWKVEIPGVEAAAHPTRMDCEDETTGISTHLEKGGPPGGEVSSLADDSAAQQPVDNWLELDTLLSYSVE
ncbi:hypothetical protein CDEST_02434 [Colletotrichum destructivum]|uniref:Zn(2)-C6 fungal-type domain-containing protein n=1 Tax=Colletotrichum destructivum TaxID=34406 RepID=A0AAX4I2F2_9PEZI|nr:hypothetical protein CDEST_02434 [Colletotrichum destructivum]